MSSTKKMQIHGLKGATFTPSVDSNGNLSWSNDRELPNPTTVNIKGPKGDTGSPGANGTNGTNGINGIDGKSAYQQAVEGGYTGTEAEFKMILADAETKSRVNDLFGSEHTAEGEFIAISDQATPPCIEQLTLYGRSDQSATPSPDAPCPIASTAEGGGLTVKTCGRNLIPNNYGTSEFTHNGITFRVQSDGAIIVTGAASGHATFTLVSQTVNDIRGIINNEKVTLSGARGNVRIRFWNYDASQSFVDDIGNGASAVFIDNGQNYNITLLVPAGITADNVIIHPMLELGDTPSAWVPYHTASAALSNTAHPDSPIFPLRGIPVSSGGNVTIGGQQYVADTLTKFADGTGEVVKRVRHSVKNISDMAYDPAYAGWNNDPYLKYDIPHVGSRTQPIMCSIFPMGSGIGVNTYDPVSAIYFPKDTFGLTEAEWIEQYPGLDVQFLWPMATPITIPLTAEEVNALESLQAFQPVTNIYNDAGAHMSTVYTTGQMAVTGNLKKENNVQKLQIEELRNAILAMGSNV